MEIETRKHHRALVVKPMVKRLDMSVSREFKETMIELINAGNTWVVLDISGVDFIDSSGLSAMISALKMIGNSGKLTVSGITGPVKSMFRLTRMDRVFQIYADAEEAIRSLSSTEDVL